MALWMVSDKASLPGTHSSIHPGSPEAGPGPLAQPESLSGSWTHHGKLWIAVNGFPLSREGMQASVAWQIQAPGPRRQPTHTSLGSPVSSLGALHPVHSGVTLAPRQGQIHPSHGKGQPCGRWVGPRCLCDIEQARWPLKAEAGLFSLKKKKKVSFILLIALEVSLLKCHILFIF